MRQMKDSGIEYIGKIPDTWEISNLKYNGFTKSGLGNKKPEDFGHGYPFITYKNIYNNFYINENIEDLVDSTDDDREKCNVLRGDVFFTGSSETIEELGLSSVCLRDIKDATYNGFSIRFRPYNLNKFHPEFMMYYFRSYATREHLIRNDNSITRANLSQKLLNMLPVLFPSFDEQQKIANYLDNKVALIDNIIEKTKESIEEYKKLKQSIITETVTKGLNPDVKMKDSGIEWIGEIPEHWKIYKLKHLLNCPLQYGANESGVIYDENLPRYIRITDINIQDNLLKNENILSLSEEQAKNFILKDNDILFARSGATVGKTFIYKKEYGRSAFAGYLIKAEIQNSINAMFVYLFTLSSSYDEWKNQIFIKATIQNIGADKYSNMDIAIPLTIEEQIAVVNFIIKEIKLYDEIINKKVQIVSELESYKKSLIYEVVTGKKEIA